MKIVFYSTNDVFKAEEEYQNNNIECRIVPTPATDKAYCGVCIEVDENVPIDVLVGMDYEIIYQWVNEMAFTDLSLLKHYKTYKNNVVKEFYTPVLEEAVLYLYLSIENGSTNLIEKWSTI